ncbi:class I ribonucleotide reductase maintenance protein YfaE [Psittacicella hinzii]|uniref:(2Fe-2S)-binding protein n=1 Tax=Psittacicella hinzii TaxID=2028575 RepID=A0A3A1YQS1_9GAMM|nr:class I ribonucleotide reductase maintenance protein YfaE [Psittacicella hinzii]RIY39995.1 (2Fe-2S)-binding protein [Psittacicella hinzii]
MKKFKITLSLSGISFDYDNSIPLLTAIEQQGIKPEYGCREGYCGSCRTVVATGKWHYPSPPLGFVRPGQILLCCAVVESDLILEL